MLVIPPILIWLVRDSVVDQYDLSHLRRFSTGAAPVSEEILQLLQRKFPQTRFKQEVYDYKYARAVDTPIPCTEAKIIDLDVVMGYLNNPKATAKTFDSEGWLHTGDQGFIDEEGLLTITD
ncbi:MAG: hypothetical protein Q9188_000530 [Gyalolechia gomerana]